MHGTVPTTTYEPIRNGRYFDATTDLNELVASTDSSGGTMRVILRRLFAEAKRSGTEYQIINIQWEDEHTYKGGFKITIQLTRYVGDRLTDFAFTLHHHYPFRAPLQMTVNGVAISHEKYAALEALGRRPPKEEALGRRPPEGGVPPPRTPPPPVGQLTPIGGIAPQQILGTATPSAIGLCDEVKQELGRACPRCLYCQLYGEGTWSPTKFLGTQVDEYLAVREDVVGAICRGVGREKLMSYRVELPEVIIDEILEWIG